MNLRNVQVSIFGSVFKDCTTARKANFSLSIVVIVDISFNVDESTIVNFEIVSILQHCDMTV